MHSFSASDERYSFHMYMLHDTSHVMRSWHFSSSVNSFLQTRMRSHPVRLDVGFLVGPFVYFHTSCERKAKVLARLRGCAGSPEPSLVAYVISSIISWAGSYKNCKVGTRFQGQGLARLQEITTIFQIKRCCILTNLLFIGLYCNY